MKEYVCTLGHITWRDRKGRCSEPGCRAPGEWSGRRRGFLLDDHEAMAAVMALVGPLSEDGSGHWPWRGPLWGAQPRWRGLEIRREMWAWFMGDDWNLPQGGTKCGESQCIRPSHTLLSRAALRAAGVAGI